MPIHFMCSCVYICIEYCTLHAVNVHASYTMYMIYWQVLSGLINEWMVFCVRQWSMTNCSSSALVVSSLECIVLWAQSDSLRSCNWSINNRPSLTVLSAGMSHKAFDNVGCGGGMWQAVTARAADYQNTTGWDLENTVFVVHCQSLVVFFARVTSTYVWKSCQICFTDFNGQLANNYQQLE